MSDKHGYLVDAHVHLHDGFDLEKTLSAASRNVAEAASTLGWAAPGPAMLLLTESAGVDAFGTLPEQVGEWQIIATEEAISRRAVGPNGAELAIVSGRQVVSSEGLEIHALGTREVFADKTPLRDLISAIIDKDALAVMPWGVGKWSGSRGKLVADLVSSAPPELIFADSGVRPAFVPRSKLLALAEAQGRRIIAGTDPLPVAGDEDKPGRFGFIAEDVFDAATPFQDLAAWLRGQRGSCRIYGKLETPFRFVRLQVAMQIRKRFG